MRRIALIAVGVTVALLAALHLHAEPARSNQPIVVALPPTNDAAAAPPAPASDAAPPPQSATETAAAPAEPRSDAAAASAVSAPPPDRLEAMAQRFASQPAAAETLAPVAGAERESLPLGSRSTSSVAPGANAPPSTGSWFWSTLAALTGVILLILALKSVLSRFTGQGHASANSPVLEVLTRVSVAPRNHVLLMRLGRRILVVGDSAAGMQTLADIDDPEEIAAILQSVSASKPNSITNQFSQMLGRFDGDYKDEDRIADEGSDTAEHRVDSARNGLSGLLARVRTISGGTSQAPTGGGGRRP